MIRRCRCGHRILVQHVPTDHHMTEFMTVFHSITSGDLRRIYSCPDCSDFLRENQLLPDCDPDPGRLVMEIYAVLFFAPLVFLALADLAGNSIAGRRNRRIMRKMEKRDDG